ncbi:clpC2 (apicoplast) [Theileria orientalis]|uniref:ClpC2 n=1 Tax=Theileria orientalis TaxID=68886 RepID=A0A976SI48_THEOR|nr:clpC2 [Theileria orientalis]
MCKNSLKYVYDNSLNALFKNKKLYKFPFKVSKIETIHSFYDKIIVFLNGLKSNNFSILTVDKEFDLYDFIEYNLKKKGYKKEYFHLEDSFKTLALIKDDKILVFFKRSSLFLPFHKHIKDFDQKLKKYEKFKLNFILVTTKKFEINEKNIKVEKFFSRLVTSFYFDNYLKEFFLNINNLQLNLYGKPNIVDNLKSKLFDQDEIINSTVSSLKQLDNKNPFINKPIASWLLCGPSGSGKTEFAKVLAHSLYGSIDCLLKIDMSEYLEKGSSSKFLGASPGYSGYGEHTVLSEKFLKYSSLIVLFDEVEKADVNVFNTMLQTLDEGKLALSNGRLLDFSKSFIILTSNLGYSDNNKDKIVKKEEVLDAVNSHFRVEFLNRLSQIVIFNAVGEDSYYNILDKFITTSFYRFDLCVSDVDVLLKDDFTKWYCDKIYGSRPLRKFIYNFSNFIYLTSNILNYFSHSDYNYINNINTFNMGSML